MNTTKATPIPGSIREGGYWEFSEKREIWRLPVGTIFEDGYHKQQFEVITRGQVRHAIQCLASPFEEGQDIGPICSAFFTTPRTILFREGRLQVFIRPEQKEEGHAQEA